LTGLGRRSTVASLGLLFVAAVAVDDLLRKRISEESRDRALAQTGKEFKEG
jgi:hypothetical protein